LLNRGQNFLSLYLSTIYETKLVAIIPDPASNGKKIGLQQPRSSPHVAGLFVAQAEEAVDDRLDVLAIGDDHALPGAN